RSREFARVHRAQSVCHRRIRHDSVGRRRDRGRIHGADRHRLPGDPRWDVLQRRCGGWRPARGAIPQSDWRRANGAPRLPGDPAVMPGQINSVPVGLLDLLGIQSQGTNPGALSDFVQSTLDLSNLYLTWKRRNLVDSTFFGAAATSSVVLATVPANEYWYLLGGALVNLSAP